MKISESQLRQIIAEETQQLVDEGFLDALKGGAAEVGAGIKRYGAKIKRAGQLASLAGDLKKITEKTNVLYSRIRKLLPDVYAGDLDGPGALGADIESGLQAAARLVDMLKNKEITEDTGTEEHND